MVYEIYIEQKVVGKNITVFTARCLSKSELRDNL